MFFCDDMCIQGRRKRGGLLIAGRCKYTGAYRTLLAEFSTIFSFSVLVKNRLLVAAFLVSIGSSCFRAYIDIYTFFYVSA